MVASKSRVFDYKDEKWIAIPVEIYGRLLDDLLVGWFEGNELVSPGHPTHPRSSDVSDLKQHKLDFGEAMKAIESGSNFAILAPAGEVRKT